jgi:hypothetical protein
MGNYQVITHFMGPTRRQGREIAPVRISAEEYHIKKKYLLQFHPLDVPLLCTLNERVRVILSCAMLSLFSVIVIVSPPWCNTAVHHS